MDERLSNIEEQRQQALKNSNSLYEGMLQNNQDLYNCIQGLPKIIKKLFIKDFNIKLLNN